MACIKDLTEDDLPLIAPMEQALFADSAWSMEDYLLALKDPYQHYLALWEDGELIAYSGYFVLYENAEILTVGVDKKHQGNGYAKQLMEEMLAQAKQKGAEMMSLEVRVSNERAIRLYERYGFMRVALRRRYYRDGEDALLMIKEMGVI